MKVNQLKSIILGKQWDLDVVGEPRVKKCS